MQTLIFGLVYGGIYAMMALAIGIVNSTSRIMNFSHAMVMMWGAMCAYYLYTMQGWPLILSLLTAIVVNMLLNIVIYKICVQHLGDLSANTNWIISLFGMAHIIQNLARMLFGTETYSFPYLFNGAKIYIFGTAVMWHEIAMFVIAIVIGVVYQTMSQKTRFGRSIRAVAYKPDTAKLMGIDSQKVMLICFGMAGAVSAIAGCLVAPIIYASYSMTATVGLKGYAAALIGGVGNTKGALIGGFALGLIECLLGLFVSPAIRDVFSFAIMILVIIFLPGGVMSAKVFTKGRTTTEKV